MPLKHLYRHHAVWLCLVGTLSLTGAVASQPANLPCSTLSGSTQSLCLRQKNLSFAPQTAADRALAASSTPNLAVDQALVALTDDVTVLPKSSNTPVALKIGLRNAPTAAVKAKAVATKVAYKAPPAKVELSRSQIVRHELNREKAALQRAENLLQAARKSGQNIASLERQIADRRASIVALQAELSRL